MTQSATGDQTPHVTATISLADGSCRIRATRSPRLARSARPWREEHLAAALILAPEALGLGNATLVNRAGRRTVVEADVLYRDAVGRAHVIELKNEAAGLSALAQVLSYGDLLRSVRDADMSCVRYGRLAELEREGNLTLLREWAGASNRGLAATTPQPRAPEQKGLAHGLPVRHILVAPSFEKELGRSVEELTKRGTSVELWKAQLGVAGKNVLLGLEPAHRREHIERTWNGFEAVWASADMRRLFTVVGFADERAYHTFALALKADPRVRIWLTAQEDEPDRVWLSAWPPDKYGTASQRRRIVNSLEACPIRPSREEGWLWWKVPLNKPKKAAQTATVVAKAVEDAFAPHSAGVSY